ncbi:hypothetical protein GE061_006233 [Apolygus lucorum]|uniref:Uncharacterized protein n=1 Tax=Apolygus lucorum TaxID=248454 RepID=A0A8S9WX94_APOLU|nr:hypothetical protein GE061_006233 [Apolygus lucorum]
MEKRNTEDVASSSVDSRDVGSSTSEEMSSSTSETVSTSTSDRKDSSKPTETLEVGGEKTKTWQKSVEQMLNEYIAENFGVKTSYELKDGKIVDKTTGEVVVDVPRSKLLVTSSSELTEDNLQSQERVPADSLSVVPTGDEPSAC